MDAAPHAAHAQKEQAILARYAQQLTQRPLALVKNMAEGAAIADDGIELAVAKLPQVHHVRLDPRLDGIGIAGCPGVALVELELEGRDIGDDEAAREGGQHARQLAHARADLEHTLLAGEELVQVVQMDLIADPGRRPGLFCEIGLTPLAEVRAYPSRVVGCHVCPPRQLSVRSVGQRYSRRCVLSPSLWRRRARPTTLRCVDARAIHVTPPPRWLAPRREWCIMRGLSVRRRPGQPLVRPLR